MDLSISKRYSEKISVINGIDQLLMNILTTFRLENSFKQSHKAIKINM